MEWIFTLKNTTGSPLQIPDLGWDMPIGENANILDEFDFGELAGSKSLEIAITAGNVVVNDGTSDLNATESLAFLKRAHKKYVDDQVEALESTIGGDTTAIQDEVNAIENSLGLASDGTFVAHSGTNYLDAAANAKAARELLDTRLKTTTDSTATNASAISTLQSDLADEIQNREDADTDLQTELDATQLGAGLAADGTLSPFTGTNYINTATSLKNADTLLDTAIKTVADDLAALGSGSITDLQDEVDAIEVALDLNTDGTFKQHSGTNYMDAATNAALARVALDTQIKSNNDAIIANDGDIADNAAAIAQNVTDIGTNATAITANSNAISAEETARIAADALIQTEVDAIETAVGLNTNGTFVPFTGTNYINPATSIKNASTLLDTQVKTNADAISTLGTSLTDGLDLKVDKAGDTMTGDLDMGVNEVFSTSSPSSVNAYTNKAYVDMMVQGVAPKANVKVAATTPIPASTYSNGTAGVGATLTATTVGALVLIDGVALVDGDSVLIAGQADATQNGVYLVTTVGDAGTPFVLTRRTDMDGSPANELAPGTTVPVNGGDTWAGYIFYITGEAGVNKIPGTDAIPFSYVPGSAATSNVQSEVDAIETAVGLATDGTFIAFSGTNYIDTATSVKNASTLLDTQAKANADQIATNVTDIDNNSTLIANLQTDVGDIQSVLTDLTVINGVIYAKDSVRNKWIGPTINYSFGRKNNVRNRYLELTGGMVSNLSGARTHRPLCITSMSIQLGAVAATSTTIEIRKNNSVTPIASQVVNGVAGIHVNDLDVSLAAGDYLQVYVNGGRISNPFVSVIAAYEESL